MPWRRASRAAISSSSRTCVRLPAERRSRTLDGWRSRIATLGASCSITTTCRGSGHISHTSPSSRRTDPNSLHVTINDMARRELAERDITALTIRNAFDLHPLQRRSVRRRARRSDSRATISSSSNRRARFHARRSRAASRSPSSSRRTFPIARSGTGSPVPPKTASGPSSSGSSLRRQVPVTRRPGADTVGCVRGERRRRCSLELGGLRQPGHRGDRSLSDRSPSPTIPVLDELLALGLQVFDVGAPDVIAAWLDAPDAAMFDANRACLREHFNLADLPSRISTRSTTVGWTDW